MNRQVWSVDMKLSREQENEIRYEEKKSLKRKALDYMMITAGLAVYAGSRRMFLDPKSLAPGGG